MNMFQVVLIPMLISGVLSSNAPGE